jgi:hypothetical protein
MDIISSTSADAFSCKAVHDDASVKPMEELFGLFSVILIEQVLSRYPEKFDTRVWFDWPVLRSYGASESIVLGLQITRPIRSH